MTQFYPIALMAKVTTIFLTNRKIMSYIAHIWDNGDLWHKCHVQGAWGYATPDFVLNQSTGESYI
jgi:hypothetical protein